MAVSVDGNASAAFCGGGGETGMNSGKRSSWQKKKVAAKPLRIGTSVSG